MNITSKEENRSTELLEGVLLQLLNAAVEGGKGFCLYRLPNEQAFHMLSGKFMEVDIQSEELEDLGAGFLINPFEVGAKGSFVSADVFFSFVPGEIGALDHLKTHLPDNKTGNKVWHRANVTKDFHASDQKEYLDLVRGAVLNIEEGGIQKVVPARCKKIELPQDFDPASYFSLLTRKYEKAFVSLTYIPQKGIWIGATPETLIASFNRAHFETVALAGTQAFDANRSLKEVAWTQKEIEEQALVSRYIINCFKQIRLREFSEEGPKTVKAGQLIHLKTIFKVDLKATGFFNLSTTMLRLLHPTSAVCGMPLKAAQAYLKNSEGLDRKFFSGFLGPVNIENDIRLFVNLRCMEILGPQAALLYAGAGITEDSIPEKEWEETELKMNTLLTLFASYGTHS